MATLPILQKPSVRLPVYNRPRKRRQDQIPIRWVPSQIALKDNEISTYNKSFQKYDSNCKLPPIRQKDELSGLKNTDLFERHSLYRSTYPKQPSFRPDFPRPPDQLPPNEDYQNLVSTYKNEYSDIPNDYQRPMPIPNRASWEPESDPNARSQPMISLFHNDFKPFHKHPKTRSIRHDMGYYLPREPMTSQSASSLDFDWKYQPRAPSFKPEKVYEESEKFTGTTLHRDSFKKHNSYDYAKAFSEEDIDIGPIKGFSNPRYMRQPPEGPGIDLHSAPLKCQPDITAINEHNDRFQINSTVNSAGEEQKAFSATTLNDNHSQALQRSAYSTTYRSDYIIE